MFDGHTGSYKTIGGLRVPEYSLSLTQNIDLIAYTLEYVIRASIENKLHTLIVR